MSGGGPYAIEYDPKALKELRNLDRTMARRIVNAVNALAADPRSAGTRRLTGTVGLWRLRIGDYRVIYAIEDDELLILALRVAHRSAVYRHL